MRTGNFVTFNMLGKVGGIGNCLFQMAACLALARRLGIEADFPAQSWSHELPALAFSRRVRFRATFYENGFNYSPIKNISTKGGLNLYGYFQSEKYFEDQADYITECYRQLMPETVFTDILAVHVRRGDYVGNDFHYLLPIDYYVRAMDELKPEKVMYFSDDIPWVKANMPSGSNFLYSNGNPWQDMKLMASCAALIGANSSFSWWAAWFMKRHRPDARVIFPSRWFVPEGIPDTSTLLPESWEKMSA